MRKDLWGGQHICHILGQVMHSALSIYYIKMKSFNTNKSMTEKKNVSYDVNEKNILNIQNKNLKMF